MFEIRNLTEEKVFIFLLCYMYNLNLLHIFKLYELSNTLFKSFLKAFQPILRLTTNKLILIRMQATRVFDIVTNYNPDKKYRETDLHLAKILNRHVCTIFACNERFYTVNDLENFEIFMLNEDNSTTLLPYNIFKASCMNIKNIVVGGKVFHRTTPLSFLLCKYFGDRNSREVINMGLTDIHKMIEACISE